METLPKEIVVAILSFLIEFRVRRAARVVCREWVTIIDYSEFNISCAVTPDNVDRLRDTFVKRSRPFSLSLPQARLLSAVDRLLDPLSQLIALDYPSMLPSFPRVTNLQHLSAYSANADWLLQQAHLTSLSLSEITGGRHLLVHDSLATVQSLSINHLLADPLLEAVTTTKLTALVFSATRPFNIVKYSNLKSLSLRGSRSLNMDLNLPNLEDLRVSPAMKVSSTRLTSLAVYGVQANFVDMLSNLTTLKSLTGGWTNYTEQVSHFTALRHLETLHITTAPSKNLLKYIQPHHLKHLKMFLQAQPDSIEDMAHLSCLTNLCTLDLNVALPMDLAALTPLTRLEELTLNYLNFLACPNLEVIATMTRLYHLSLIESSKVPLTLDVQALTRLTHLCICSQNTLINNVSALHALESIKATCNVDFGQLGGALLTHLDVIHRDGTLSHSLTRLTALLDLYTTDLHSDEDVIVLSVLTRLTLLSASRCTNDGRELTRLTSLQYIQYVSKNGSPAVEENLARKLTHLQQLTYVSFDKDNQS